MWRWRNVVGNEYASATIASKRGIPLRLRALLIFLLGYTAEHGNEHYNHRCKAETGPPRRQGQCKHERNGDRTTQKCGARGYRGRGQRRT
jgi:hypothetical protein